MEGGIFAGIIDYECHREPVLRLVWRSVPYGEAFPSPREKRLSFQHCNELLRERREIEVQGGVAGIVAIGQVFFLAELC